MRQLALPFGTRHEIPEAIWSWREGLATIEVIIGAHCFDTAWPHWRPWTPWSLR
jgi:hypothetical protein